MSEDVINSKCYFCKEDLFYSYKCSDCLIENYGDLCDNRIKKFCWCKAPPRMHIKCKKCLINYSDSYLNKLNYCNIYFYINEHIFQYFTHTGVIKYREKYLKIPDLKSAKELFKLANKFVKLNEIT